MTPESTDYIRGARRTLEQIVLPALEDAFAIEQVRTILRILEHLEGVVDDAYPMEWEEARDLAALLGEAMPEMVNGTLPPFRELREGNVRRKSAVANLIREGSVSPRRGETARSASEGEEAAMPPHPTLRPDLSPEGELGKLLRRQIDRDRRWTNPKARPEKTSS